MVDNELAQQLQKNILVLCVDRDGDIEVKAGIKTPLIGRDANLNAAVALALKDPEEPDANAMFEAVRLYDQEVSQKKPGENFEVVTISGTALGGVTADRKLSAELDYILKTCNVTEIIFVSDGYTDESVLPIIESRKIPISSIRRIVIKHSESIEETAAVFTKYLKLIIETPRYSRIALGLPGILVSIFALFWALNVVYGINMYYYGIAMAVIVGAFLLLKGFGVDTAVKKSYKWIHEYTPPPLPKQIANYTTIVGILCIIISIYLGIQFTTHNLQPATDIINEISRIPEVTGLFIKGIEDLLIIGAIIVLTGRSITFYFERDSKLLRNAALIVEVIWIRIIMGATSDLLRSSSADQVVVGFENVFFANFVWTVIIGIFIGVASILLITVTGKSTSKFFKKSEAIEEQKEAAVQD